MQTISRKNLQIIYNDVCQGWKTTISKVLREQQFNDEIQVEDALILKGISEANTEQKAMLKRFFKFPKSITEKISTFDDVLNLAGKKLSEILPWKSTPTKEKKSQNAFAKIQLISEVLNEGWKPDFKNANQYKYYPYFKQNALGGGWVVRDVGYFDSVAFGGAGCYFKTRELAEFASETFIEVYSDYLPE